MTTKQKDYSKGKIYKLIDNTNGDIYIGSTVRTLKDRLREHRCKNNSCISKRIINNGNYIIELIKNYPCNNVDELEKEESKYIKIQDCINIQIPTRTKNEWSKDNYAKNEDRRCYVKDYNQTYYNKNKTYYADYAKNNANRTKKVVCECGCEVRQDNLIRHRKSNKHKKLINE